MKKVERNDFCPCNSQKKFKHCCLLKKVSLTPPFESDIKWQNLQKMQRSLWEESHVFALREYGDKIFEDAWDAFCFNSPLPDHSLDGEHLFPAWFIFRWVPYDYSKEWEHLGPNVTLADLYVQKKGAQKYKKLLLAFSESPFSFFLIEDVVPSCRIVLKDLLLDRTITIKEKAGATEGIKGKVVFTRVVSYEDQAVQAGFGTLPLPLHYAMEILDIKKGLLKLEKDLTSTLLLKYDDFLRNIYFSYSKSAFKPPVITNTDGDPICSCTLHYKLQCDPKTAFNNLIVLYKRKDIESILEDALFDEQNNLCSIEFPWLKSSLKNTVLGEISIEGNKLVVTTNSIQRAKKIQREIKKRLPESVLIKTVTEELDLSNEEQPNTTPISYPSAEEQEMLKAYIADYYNKWLDISIPALKNQTPRQAAKTAEGCERLEFLLLDFEMKNPGLDPYHRIDVDKLRYELGLTIELL